MNNLQMIILEYLDFGQYQKRLDSKTIKSYRIDLYQFLFAISVDNTSDISPSMLEEYIRTLHLSFKPKTVKRKIASLKAFFHYLEYRNYIKQNPFHKIQIKFREPVIQFLQIISFYTLSCMY